MSKDLLSQGMHVVNGLYPKADAFATSMTTDYIAIRDYGGLTFIIHTGDATAGTADGTVTVLAATAAAGTGATAIAFKYQVCASSTSVDTWGALTDATSTGFSMTAGDNYMYLIHVDPDVAQNGPTAKGGDFVALKVTEVTNDPIVAGVIAIPWKARYPQAVPQTAIA